MDKEIKIEQNVPHAPKKGILKKEILVMGYSPENKGYPLYDIKQRKIIVGSDALINEVAFIRNSIGSINDKHLIGFTSSNSYNFMEENINEINIV